MAQYLRGWWGYYRIIDRYGEVNILMGWLRRRLRQIRWVQWKTGRNRWRELARLAPGHAGDWYAPAAAKCGHWRAAAMPAVHAALGNAYWQALGLPRLDRAGWKP